MTTKESLDLAKLKTAFAKISKEKENESQAESPQKEGYKIAASQDKLNDEVREVAKREAAKTEDDIYEEVFIDEVNEELLKNVLK